MKGEGTVTRWMGLGEHCGQREHYMPSFVAGGSQHIPPCELASEAGALSEGEAGKMCR